MFKTIGLLLAGLLLGFGIFYWYDSAASIDNSKVQNHEIIEKAIKNVSKLVVIEGHFSEIFTYNDTKELIGSWLTADKKAITIINAEVKISFNLSQIKYNLDVNSNVLNVTYIPKAEYTIVPDIRYYDMQSDYLNPFSPEDLNRLNEKAINQIKAQIIANQYEGKARDRLIIELSQLLFTTTKRNWTVSLGGTKGPLEMDKKSLVN